MQFAKTGERKMKTILIRDLIIGYLLPLDESVRFIDGHEQRLIYEVADVDLTPIELWRKKVVSISHGITDDGMVCIDIYYM